MRRGRQVGSDEGRREGREMKVRELLQQLESLQRPDADVWVQVNGGSDEYGGYVYRVHIESFRTDGDVTLEARP
jgi:hypothetical protein